jgi:hypothetical protein
MKSRLFACDGSGVRLATIALDEKGQEGDKYYRCHRCDRWLRASSLETIPYHLRICPDRDRGSSRPPR